MVANFHQKKRNLKPKNIESLFHDYYSPLCNFAIQIVKDSFVAEEIVQNLFIEIWEKDKFSLVQDFERYTLRSTKYKCYDHLKKQRQEVRIHELHDFTLYRIEDQELREEDIDPLLHYFAAKLPPKTREVFLLSRESGLSYKEIAVELNLSVKTVEHQMGRALRMMRILLKEHNYLPVVLLLKFF